MDIEKARGLVKQQLAKGVPEQDIRKAMLNAGFASWEVDAAFREPVKSAPREYPTPVKQEERSYVGLYLLAFFLGIIGGVIGFAVVYGKNPSKAGKILAVGIASSALSVGVYFWIESQKSGGLWSSERRGASYWLFEEGNEKGAESLFDGSGAAWDSEPVRAWPMECDSENGILAVEVQNFGGSRIFNVTIGSSLCAREMANGERKMCVARAGIDTEGSCLTAGAGERYEETVVIDYTIPSGRRQSSDGRVWSIAR